MRYKKPYAPKVGEWWEIKGTTSGARKVILINDYITHNATGQTIIGKRTSRTECWKSLVLEDCVRICFQTRAERNAAPTIPPVEGAIMLLRNARLAKISAYCPNEGFLSYTENKEDCLFEYNGNCVSGTWDDTGRFDFFVDCKHLDCVAVYIWPEDTL
jgi:hypothetical protein